MCVTQTDEALASNDIAEICCKHVILIIKYLIWESNNIFCLFDFLLKQSKFTEQIWAQISGYRHGLSTERLKWHCGLHWVKQLDTYIFLNKEKLVIFWSPKASTIKTFWSSYYYRHEWHLNYICSLGAQLKTQGA